MLSRLIKVKKREEISMFDWLKNQKFLVVLVVLGFLLVIAGFFQITDITKLAIQAYATPFYSVVAIGAVLLAGSIGLSLIEKRKVELPQDLNEHPKLLAKTVFLSAPMHSFVAAKRPKDYMKSRDQVLKIIAALKRECEIADVFYAGETIEDINDFDLPGASLRDDFRKIQEREFFVLFWPEKFTSRSSLVEAGIAITLNKKSIYFVKNEEDLPFLLYGAPNATRNVKVLKYTSLDDLLSIIQINRSKVFDFKKLG